MRTLNQAEREARSVVNKWVTGAALTGWIPGSAFFLVPADLVMIRQVADKFGIGVFDEAGIKAHLAGVVGSAVGGTAAAELLSFIPVVGWATKSAAMAAKAKIVGEAVIDYFKERSPFS